MTATIATPKAKPRWDTRPYRQIVSARFANGTLSVAFEDGATVHLAAADLRPARGGTLNWNDVRFTSFEVIVPTDADDLEIPWSTIRMLTDPDYDAHLAAAAGEQRRWIGRRIGELRNERRLSLADLAMLALVDEHDLARIEAGDPAIEFPPIQRLLEAMGRTLDDLVVVPGTRFGA